jgi:hypothetical protein
MTPQQQPLIVNGLKRSGNHLIINWLISNLGMSFENWVNGRNQHYHFQPPREIPTSYRAGVIYSFEDITLGQLRTFAIDGLVTLAIYRSLENLVSSRVAAFLGNPEFGRPPFDDYADEIDDRVFSSRLIQAEAALIDTFFEEVSSYTVSISYDQFLFDVRYRTTILRRLREHGFSVALQPNDASLIDVPEIGWGSSFLPKGERECDLKRYCTRPTQLTDDQTRAYRAVQAALK